MYAKKRFRMKSPGIQGEDRERWKRRNREMIYEEAVVNYLMRHYALPATFGVELWKQHKQNSADNFGRLTLPDFCLRTHFPLWLGSRRLEDVRQLPIAKLLREFQTTEMCRAWLEISRAAPASYRWSGLIFRVPGSKFMTLHSHPAELRPGCTRIVIPQPEQGELTVEPLSRLLSSLAPWQLSTI